MEDATSNKRFRDDSDESPEAKRLRADLLDILDDDIESVDRDPAIQDLDSVMRSFEEEIDLLAPPPPLAAEPEETVVDAGEPRQLDLGYLLEASDDELGLPPTVPSSSDEGGEAEQEPTGGEVEADAFGQIWGFDDEIPGGYDGLDFGFRPEDRDAGGEEAVVLDGGLFDYTDSLCAPSDFSDLTWRPESLPAV